MVWLILVGFASGRSTPRLFLTTEIDMIIPDLDCGYEGMMVGISFYFRAGVIISVWQSIVEEGRESDWNS